MDKVELTVTNKISAIAVAGASAREVLRRVGIELPEMEPLQVAGVSWSQAPLTIIRGDNPTVLFELWLTPDTGPALWEALIKAGARPVGTTAQELWRIGAGIPRYGQDIRERDLPHETGQQRALSFTKGCYIGQEIVERIRSRGSVHRSFTGFEIDGPLPVPGTKVQADGRDVGQITSTAALPARDGERKVALGYIRREFGSPGRELVTGEGKARFAELPFKDIATHDESWSKQTTQL
jgi:aminomethyltransferase